MTDRGRRAQNVAGAALVAAAGFCTYYAYYEFGFRCSEDFYFDCPPDEGRSTRLVVQLALAVVGFLFAILTLYFTVRQRTVFAVGCFVTGLVLYGVWGFLMDAIVHG